MTLFQTFTSRHHFQNQVHALSWVNRYGGDSWNVSSSRLDSGTCTLGSPVSQFVLLRNPRLFITSRPNISDSLLRSLKTSHISHNSSSLTHSRKPHYTATTSTSSSQSHSYPPSLPRISKRSSSSLQAFTMPTDEELTRLQSSSPENFCESIKEPDTASVDCPDSPPPTPLPPPTPVPEGTQRT